MFNEENYSLTFTTSPLMRIPSLQSFYRTLQVLGSFARRPYPSPFAPLSSPSRVPVIKSMPTIPFLSGLFGSGSPRKDDMSYPVKKSEEEWRAVLSPGLSCAKPLIYRC